MKAPFAFRQACQALIPAVLLLASCSKNDDPVITPQVVETGKINIYHMAASANVNLKFLVDDAEKASLTYGQNAGYQAVNTGGRTVKINVASTGTTANTQSVVVEKDKNYSFFAYASSPSAVNGLYITDDLTIPTASAGKARIRLVNLGLGAPTPIKLSTVVAGISDIAGTDAQFAGASSFVDIIPGQYNIAVTSGTPSTVVVNVGDGSGSGAGTNKTYEAGKIYTVVLRGITNPLLAADLQPKAVLIQNN